MCFFHKKINILIFLQYKPYIFQFVGLFATRKLLCVNNYVYIDFEVWVQRSQNPIKSPLCHPSLKWQKWTKYANR